MGHGRISPFPATALTSFCALRRLRSEGSLIDYSVFTATAQSVAGSCILGAGIDQDPALARIKAVAETLERMCLRASDRWVRHARRRDLSGSSLDPARWLPFTPAQYDEAGFPYRRWSDETEYRWSRGIDLASGNSVWVPACLVGLNETDRLIAGVSTGAAAHPSPASALCAGLYEVVERDALSIVWEARATVPSLSPDAEWQKAETRGLAAGLSRLGLRLYLRDITTDIPIPAAMAVVVDPVGRRPALAIGAAAGPDLGTACRKATLEGYLTWCWMFDEHRRRSIDLTRARILAEAPADMMWQAYLYGFPDAMQDAGHLFAPTDLGRAPTQVSFDETDEAATARLVSVLVDAGYRPIAVEIDSVEADALGFVVVKAIVPGLVPLSIGSRCRPLGNPRISDVPAKLGWRHFGPRPIGHGLPIPLP
jgi:ribosomal protein S12 methylthiotransferase accessory factor